MGGRVGLWLSGVLAFGIGVVLVALDQPLWDAGGPGIVGFELAGSEAAARRILVEWGQDGIDAARVSLWIDFAYLIAYGAFLALAVAALRPRRRWLIWFGPAAAVCDAIEDVCLLIVLDERALSTSAPLAAGSAAVKFLLVGVAIAYIAVALIRRRPRVALTLAAAAVVVVVGSVLYAELDTAPGREDGGALFRVDDRDVHVREDGPPDGPPLLLVHGFTASGRWWDPVVPRLSRQFRVIRIDLLGHGGSEKPRDGYTMEEQADLVADVARQVGVDRAAVVAHSMGGAVATALAERHRTLVDRLMVIGTSPLPYDGGVNLYTGAFLPVTGHLSRLYVQDDILRWVAEQGLRPEVDASDAQIDAIDAVTYRSFTQSSKAADDFKKDQPLDERLAGTGVPLTVVFGATDAEADDGRRYRGAQRTIPDAGHSPMIDAPTQMASVIEEFALRPGR